MFHFGLFSLILYIVLNGKSASLVSRGYIRSRQHMNSNPTTLFQSSECYGSDIQKIYEGISYDGYGEDIYLNSNRATSTVTDISKNEYSETLYGELLPSSLHDIIKSYLQKIDESDVIYDLGSGVGKVVIQFALETKARKCVGIELGLRRHQASLEAHKKLLEDRSIISSSENSLEHRIAFVHGNIMEDDWSDSTVLFINAFVFSEEIMDYIEKKVVDINNAAIVGANGKSIVKYILLFGQRFSSAFMAKQDYRLVVALAPQSFSDDSNCELYIHNSVAV